MMRISETVKHLIIINIVFWIGTLTIGQFGNVFGDLFAMHFPINDEFKPWQVITHMFMHASYVDYGSGPTIFPLHILFNMLGLWMFGSPLEQIWGRNKFLFFYFSCGIGAVLLPFIIDYINFDSIVKSLVENGFSKNSIISLLNEGKIDTRWANIVGDDNVSKIAEIFLSPSLGASGCVMGLLVAFGMMFPNSELMLIFLPIPIKAKYFIPLLLGYEIYSGISGGNSMFGFNVGHFAHIGGAFIGFIMAWYWKKNQFNQNRWY
ncbi:rhomboid family intramembrane serine protease [Mariniflexile soesokkakense]|uniref:Rhomboid family intramembrane serine protease n=1 Tax=Mariniflexile soesokkakense TaxID=1343160 RepID=A0ABV0A9E7_9FLAO